MSYTRSPFAAHWHSIDTITNGTYPPQVGTDSSGVFPSANLAIYVPVIVQRRIVVKQLWYGNGASAIGNYDIGLYDAAGTALLRKGSTAKTSSTAEVVWDCTDTTIGPGIYYLALASSSATDIFAGASVAATLPAAMGLLSEASALPLPATATFAVPQTLAFVPIIGMFLDTRVS